MLKGVVKYIVGTVFGRNGEQITTQTEAWKQEADCGCGIDCCYGALVLIDQTTREASYLYIDNGVPMVTTDPKTDLNKVG